MDAAVGMAEAIAAGLMKVNSGQYSYVRTEGLLSILDVVSRCAPSDEGKLNATQREHDVVKALFERILDDTSAALAPAQSSTEQQRALELVQGMVLLCPQSRVTLSTPTHIKALLKCFHRPGVPVRIAALEVLTIALTHSPPAQPHFMDALGIETVVKLLKDGDAHRVCRAKAAEFLQMLIEFVDPNEAPSKGTTLTPKLTGDPSTYYRDNVARCLGIKLTLELMSKSGLAEDVDASDPNAVIGEGLSDLLELIDRCRRQKFAIH